jgi:hypothetical protein
MCCMAGLSGIDTSPKMLARLLVFVTSTSGRFLHALSGWR